MKIIIICVIIAIFLFYYGWKEKKRIKEFDKLIFQNTIREACYQMRKSLIDCNKASYLANKKVYKDWLDLYAKAFETDEFYLSYLEKLDQLEKEYVEVFYQ